MVPGSEVVLSTRKMSLSSVLACAVLLAVGGPSLSTASGLESADSTQSPLRVEIAIKARQFVPSSVSIPARRKVFLVFRNEDAELHAFVPLRFLEQVPLHVDGNGAPQFGEQGLVRVLIPSGGHVEIQFVPSVEGLYRYRCDLPGHQMVGEIRVIEPGRDAGVEKKSLAPSSSRKGRSNVPGKGDSGGTAVGLR